MKKAVTGVVAWKKPEVKASPAKELTKKLDAPGPGDYEVVKSRA